MARKIIKKIGGDRIGSGNKMTVSAHGYGYSTHDVGKVRRTSMSFGTIVPMGQWLLPTGARLRLKLDALITSNALLYQLYGSAKFQVDVFSARMALYNPKMLLNLNDQGYNIEDIKFPQMRLQTKAFDGITNISNQQINPSSLLRHLGISANGVNFENALSPVTRDWMAQWLLMYYQTVKEYYCNKQEGVGYLIHSGSTRYNGTFSNVRWVNSGGNTELNYETPTTEVFGDATAELWVDFNAEKPTENQIGLFIEGKGFLIGPLIYNTVRYQGNTMILGGFTLLDSTYQVTWGYVSEPNYDRPTLQEWDLKAVDRMMMRIMAGVEDDAALVIEPLDGFPYAASLQREEIDDIVYYSINGTQEGICVGTYQSDVFNNWLNNETINALSNKNKVKVDENGEFSIDMLSLTQKLYNYDMRIGVTDGTLEEWREMTYAQVSKSKSLKPVYEGGLSKEIVFDMVVSSASTDEAPLGSIASRGQFGNKHKGGYVQIDTDEEKLVMVLAKITPRLVYNQGNDWTNNLKTLDDLHKPALDKIGYQNLLTDQMAGFETRVKADRSLVTYTAGKQPAWQWYRTNYDDALGNMADTESYKVFGREYESDNGYRIKDLTTYIDPRKFNDVFAIESLDAMNFDVQVGMDATLTLVMSEEVIPNL